MMSGFYSLAYSRPPLEQPIGVRTAVLSYFPNVIPYLKLVEFVGHIAGHIMHCGLEQDIPGISRSSNKDILAIATTSDS